MTPSQARRISDIRRQRIDHARMLANDPMTLTEDAEALRGRLDSIANILNGSVEPHTLDEIERLQALAARELEL